MLWKQQQGAHLRPCSCNAANRTGSCWPTDGTKHVVSEAKSATRRSGDKGQIGLDGPISCGVEVLPLSSFLVNDLSRRQAPTAPLDAPNLSLDLRVRNQKVAKFEPDWRRLARNFVIGPGAAGDISSAYNIIQMRLVKSLKKNCWSTVAVTSPTKRIREYINSNQSCNQYCKGFAS